MLVAQIDTKDSTKTATATRPSETRQHVQPETLPLRKEFRAIQDHFYAHDSQFASTQPTNDKKTLITAFSQDIAWLQEFYAATLFLILKALVANVHVETDEHNKVKQSELRSAGLKELQKHVPQWKFRIGNVLDWNKAAMSPADLWRDLGICLCDSLDRFFLGLQQHLDEMVDARLFGLYEEHPSPNGTDVARYHFFRLLLRQVCLGSKQQREAVREENRAKNSWTEVETTTATHKQRRFVLYQRHEHDIYERWMKCWPAADEPQPEWVQAFMQSIPELWRPYIRVAGGEMLKDEVHSTVQYTRSFQEQEVVERVIRQGRLISPAVLIGDVVLTGWSDADFLPTPVDPVRRVVSRLRRNR